MTVVDFITFDETISVVVLLADAVIADGSVDTGRVGVALVVTRFALVDWANEGVVVSGEPSFPFCSVDWVAYFENVLEKCIHTVKELLGRINVMEVDKRAWNSTGFNRTFSTVPIVILIM